MKRSNWKMRLKFPKGLRSLFGKRSRSKAKSGPSVVREMPEHEERRRSRDAVGPGRAQQSSNSGETRGLSVGLVRVSTSEKFRDPTSRFGHKQEGSVAAPPANRERTVPPGEEGASRADDGIPATDSDTPVQRATAMDDLAGQVTTPLDPALTTHDSEAPEASSIRQPEGVQTRSHKRRREDEQTGRSSSVADQTQQVEQGRPESSLTRESSRLERVRAELRTVKSENKKLSSKYQRQEDENKSYIKQLQEKDHEIENFKKRNETQSIEIKGHKEGLSGAMRRIKELEDLVKKQTTELEDSKARLRQIDVLKTKMQQTDDLLAARSAELDSLRTFFPTIDSISSAQLKQMMDDLNDEIFQVASMIVELLEDKDRGAPRDPEALQESRDRIVESGALPGELIEGFANDSFLWEDDVVMAVQVAMQACMSCACQYVVRGTFYGAGDQLQELLEEIQATESYPVFARWRAMVQKQKAGPDNQKQWEEYLMATLLDVLAVCGYQGSLQECVDQIEARVQRLVSMALKLNHAIMQETFSMDVYVSWFPAESAFVPIEMKDENERPSSKSRVSPGTPILATTALGLSLRPVKVNNQDLSKKPDIWEVAIRAAVALPESIQYKAPTSKSNDPDVDVDVAMSGVNSDGDID